MGIISDILSGKSDYVYGEPAYLSDPRTWPQPKKNANIPKKDEEEEEKPSTSHEADEITSNFDSDEE